MTIEVGVLIGLTCSVVGAIIGIAGYRRTERKEAVAEGQSNGTILAEIGYIRAGIDDIKRKQEKQDSNHVDVISRLTAVEASAKQAHHRLDRMENKEKGGS